MQAELLIRVGRGEPSLLDHGAGQLGAATGPALGAGGAVVFGTAVGALRVVFGRHFVTDVVLAGVITLVVIVALYRLLLDPVRRNDARLERALSASRRRCTA